MRHLRLASLAFAAAPLLAAAPAAANDAVGFGVGIESSLASIGSDDGGVDNAAAVTYQAGAFHVQGLLGFHDEGTTEIELGGRFMWHLHSTAVSDFSVGGGLGIVNVDVGDESFTELSIEAGAQIRAFVTTNISLNAMLGFAYVKVEDVDAAYGLRGDLVSNFGATYYFF